METIKLTYQEIGEFVDAGRRYIEQHQEDSKLRYAINRTLKSATRIMTDYRDKVDEINIKHCLAADEGKGEILRDDRGQYKFTKEGMLKRNADVGALVRTEVPFEVHFATDLPKDLSQADQDSFSGIVIRENDEEESKLEVVN